MKRFSLILIAFIYLYTIVGVNINVHYCFGEFHSISFSSEKALCVCEKYAKKPMPCCSDVSFSYQVDDEQIKIQSDLNLEISEIINSATAYYTVTDLFYNSKITEYQLSKALPLPIPSPDLNILFQVFRI